MAILGAALRAELANAIGFSFLHQDLRHLRRALDRVGTLVQRHKSPRAERADNDVQPRISASQIRAARARLGESRKAFAARLAVSPSIIFLWESGRRSPQREAIITRLRTVIGAPARSGRNGRKLRLSPQRRAQLKLQGQYIGHMRNLSKAAKAQVRTAKEQKGYTAAIRLAKRLQKG